MYDYQKAFTGVPTTALVDVNLILEIPSVSASYRTESG